jgi:hypothetical protein
LAYIKRAKAKRNLGDLQGAIDNCDVTIKLNSRIAEAFLIRGTVKSKLKNYFGTTQDF